VSKCIRSQPSELIVNPVRLGKSPRVMVVWFRTPPRGLASTTFLVDGDVASSTPCPLAKHHAMPPSECHSRHR
jgi:hypothetical protein